MRNEKTEEEIKEEKRRKNKEYYEKNKEAILNKQKNYNVTNKEKRKEKRKEINRKYRENNLEKIKEISLNYRESNKDYFQNYYNNNKEKIIKRAKEHRKNNLENVKITRNKRQKERTKEDYVFRIKRNLSSIIRQSLYKNGYTKESHTHEILGCSFEDFKIHLENQFETWMGWDNYGNPIDGLYEPNKTWDIDHIIPTSSATSEDELLKLNHFTNLRPLCSFNNRWIKKDN